MRGRGCIGQQCHFQEIGVSQSATFQIKEWEGMQSWSSLMVNCLCMFPSIFVICAQHQALSLKATRRCTWRHLKFSSKLWCVFVDRKNSKNSAVGTIPKRPTKPSWSVFGSQPGNNSLFDSCNWQSEEWLSRKMGPSLGNMNLASPYTKERDCRCQITQQ